MLSCWKLCKYLRVVVSVLQCSDIRVSERLSCSLPGLSAADVWEADVRTGQAWSDAFPEDFLSLQWFNVLDSPGLGLIVFGLIGIAEAFFHRQPEVIRCC